MSILVITSTVNVNSNLTVLVDPEIRLKQYVSSILFYININTISKIIVCDNSGFNYSNVKSINEEAKKKSKKIELLSFVSESKNTMKYGKGYGEGEIMKFIVTNSELYNGKEKSFFKVTGRIIISNIESVIQFTSLNKNYFQRIVFNSFSSEVKFDTRFYHFKKYDFETYLVDSYKSVNDSEGVYLEHVFFRTIEKNKIQYSYFLILPFIKGVSGSTGSIYTLPMKTYFKNFFVNFLLYFININ